MLVLQADLIFALILFFAAIAVSIGASALPVQSKKPNSKDGAGE
jgi:hypothetical protein